MSIFSDARLATFLDETHARFAIISVSIFSGFTAHNCSVFEKEYGCFHLHVVTFASSLKYGLQAQQNSHQGQSICQQVSFNCPLNF